MRNMLPTVAALASAATAASLLPSDVTSLAAPSKTLSISFPQPTGGKNVEVEHPGEVLAPNETSLQPLVGMRGNSHDLSTDATYIIMMLDPAPLIGVPKSTVLHWLDGNLTFDSMHDRYITVDPDNVYNDPNAAAAPYVSPGPAPGITKPDHHYTVMLFEQPSGFKVPQNYTKFLALESGGAANRIGFPYTEFIKQTGLGQPIASAWWIEKTPACNGTRQDYFGMCPPPGSSKSKPAMISTPVSTPSATGQPVTYTGEAHAKRASVFFVGGVASIVWLGLTSL